jgi:peptidoglycan/LPS O-acetylase OafA/YrhL
MTFEESTDARVQHLRKLDAIRGLSAITVLVGHAMMFVSPRLGANHWLVVLLGNFARHAVLVFFLLSGYLITQSILANMRRNAGAFDAADYLASRATRIYPPLIGAVIFTLLIGAIIHGLDLPGAKAYGAGAVRQSYAAPVAEAFKALVMADGMLQANGPLWSLYIEVHIYVVAMLVTLAWTRRSMIWAGAAAVLAAYYFGQSIEFSLFSVAWGLGALAALAPEHMRMVRWAGAICALAMIGIAIHDPTLLNFQGDPRGAPLLPVYALAYLWAVILTPGLWRSPPEWVVGTAAFSYSLYVIHFPLMLFAVSLGATGWLGAALACVGCLAIAVPFARVL